MTNAFVKIFVGTKMELLETEANEFEQGAGFLPVGFSMGEINNGLSIKKLHPEFKETIVWLAVLFKKE